MADYEYVPVLLVVERSWADAVRRKSPTSAVNAKFVSKEEWADPIKNLPAAYVEATPHPKLPGVLTLRMEAKKPPVSTSRTSRQKKADAEARA